MNFYLGKTFSADELDQIQSQINQSPDLACLAESHGVAPLFYHFIKHHQLNVNTQIKRQFQSLALRHHHAASVREKVLLELTNLLSENKIQIIFLKGSALGKMIYRDLMHRPMRDIDILIPKADLSTAESLMLKMGFVFDPKHASIYMGNHHHLPNAILMRDGLQITMELHHNVYSRDTLGSQTFEQCIGNAQKFNLNETVQGITLDHAVMLNHLCRHAFSLGSQVRLIHQLDIIRYMQVFLSDIDFSLLFKQNPNVLNTVRCLYFSVYIPEEILKYLDIPKCQAPSGVGKAMLPYSFILANKTSFASRLKALLFPSAWWMHVNYCINPEHSLLGCYVLKHPARIVKDISLRLYYAVKHTLSLKS